MIGEACQTLKRNRERYLAHRSTHSLVQALSDVARSWLEPDYPFRKLALEQGPAATGFSRATLARGLDSFFKQLTREHFHALLEQDLGHAHRLDEMVSGEAERKSQPRLPGDRSRTAGRISRRATCRIPRCRRWCWACWCGRRSS